jgi:hypothetical protein
MIPLPEPRRVGLWTRLSLAEIAIIDEMVERMGTGTMKHDVIEEALRRYLPALERHETFVQRSDKKRVDRRKSSQQAARRYMVSAGLVADLKRVAETHGWKQAAIIRHAILTFYEQA